ncbi:MAG: formate dehydrogenase subunit gamma, partial [bacterium]
MNSNDVDIKEMEVIRKELHQYLQEMLKSQLNEEAEPDIVDSLMQRLETHIDVEVERLKERVKDDIRRQVELKVKELKKEKRRKKKLKVQEESFVRLSLTLRIQHIVLFVSCIILIVTGLPVKFHETGWAAFIFSLFGGIKVTSLLHRVGATGLIGVGIYHLLHTMFNKAGRRDFWLLLPRFNDLGDLMTMIKFYLGKSKEKARFGRFSYVEKFDYWAVYWGMVIMIGSGLLMWFEEISLRFVPKFVIDIAMEAHSDEGLLATLAIIIWHFYNVHFNPDKFPMNNVWLSGRITKREMLEEHPLEYEEILQKKQQEKA